VPENTNLADFKPWRKENSVKNSMSSETQEHRLRQQTTEHEAQAGPDSSGLPDQASNFASPGLLRDISLGNRSDRSGRANAPTRIAAMQSAQRAYGNRAVQRFLSTSSATSQAPLPVQRYRPPDQDWSQQRHRAAMGRLVNGAEAVPGIGNALSLMGFATSSVDSILEDDPSQAEYSRQMAKQQAFHAIPVIGNIAAFQDALQDHNALEDIENGATTTPKLAEDRWVNETGPQVDKEISQFKKDLSQVQIFESMF